MAVRYRGRYSQESVTMTSRRVVIFLSLTLGCLTVAGCSTRAWYEGMKLGAQNECLRQPPSERDGCLSRANTLSFEDYERKRSAAKQ